MAVRAIKGMNDVLPAEAARWQRVEALFHETMRRAGFGEVRTPIVESTSLFVRTIGEATDVVEKEMYSFEHHHDSLTIRPEGTAGAARAYVEHEIHKNEPVSRWYYAGAMFRAERPQRGRYRQFHQVGAEIFGDAGPACDAELIDLLVGFLKELGIPDLRVLVNSIGGPGVRVRYREALVAFLTPKKESLSAESQRRLDTNPLRILDSKNPQDIEAAVGAPNLADSFDDDDRAHFAALQAHLAALGTPFSIEPRLVRGLDYYTRTLFEIKGATEKLGAGDTLVGGGRYDGMIQELGGPSVPAIGFAAGLERLLIATEETKPQPLADAFVAPLGEKAITEALVLARDLRSHGVSTLADTRGGSLKSQLRRANAIGCRVALVIGDSEIEKNVVQLKDLDGHAQQEIARADVVRILADRFVKTLAIILFCLFFPKIALAQSQPGDPQGGDDQAAPPPTQTVQRSGEPVLTAGDHPLEMSKEVRERIGTDTDGSPPAAVGETKRSFFPYYQSSQGDSRFRFLPPLYLENTRGLPTPEVPDSIPDTQRMIPPLMFYQRRSADMDADVVFPLFWRVRDHENHVLVLGPLAHREAPNEHDNWLAPLFFSGGHTTSGYFHSPPLLTYSHWDKDSALTISATFFRKRTGTDVDLGLIPLFFAGDNGDIDGARRTYQLIPPLLYYHRYRELEDSSMTVTGPLIFASDPKRSVFDVAPFFFHIQGKPETGGVVESHTTLFPLFHYGYSPEQRLFIVPGYLRRVSRTADTMLTPFFSQAVARSGGTTFTAIGPILPIFYNYTDRDLKTHAFSILPLYYQSDSPRGHDMLTPLYGQFKTYGVSRTDWVAPTLVYSHDLHGWEADFHPLLYVGRTDGSSHTVFAPVFWDFATPASRTTVAFPLFWRFADSTDNSVVQVAANTVYIQKRAPGGGVDWQFHVAPLFSYGQDPQGYFWNVLFGLAGYQREGDYARIRAFWIPIKVAGPSAPVQQAAWNER